MIAGQDDDLVRNVIVNGRNSMPARGTVLPDEDIDAVIAFLRDRQSG